VRHTIQRIICMYRRLGTFCVATRLLHFAQFICGRPTRYSAWAQKNVPTLRYRGLLLFVALVINTPAWAAPVDTFVFESNEQEEIFKKLSDEFRCLVCQNQNIADSNSGLAQDLRLEIYNMIKSGQTENEIVDFMVQRYGDYVLYRPPFKPLTWILWLGPVIIFIGGMIYAVRIIRDKENNTVVTDLSAEDDDRLQNLRAGNIANSLEKEDESK